MAKKTKKKNPDAEKAVDKKTEEIVVEEAAADEVSAEEATTDETAAEASNETGAAEGNADSAETEEAEQNASEQKKKVGGFFEKKDPKEEQIADLTDRLQRQMAEFENFRKRTEKEKSTMYDMGAGDILEKLLPVIDNFERGLQEAPEGDPFAEGMQMIYKQLMTMLEEAGVKPIEAAGCPFDPNLHNAVMHIEDDSVGENTVVEELQKGYLYKENVLRFSMVKVAN